LPNDAVPYTITLPPHWNPQIFCKIISPLKILMNFRLIVDNTLDVKFMEKI